MTTMTAIPGDPEIPPLPTETTPLIGPPKPADPAAAPDHNNSDDGDDERTVLAEELPAGRLYLIMGTAWVGVFLGAIDSTIFATLSGPISSEFKSLSLFSWLATAYIIANAACQPISGRLTDIFGRGPGLVFSNVFFAVGNLMCAMSRGSTGMILGRVVAGIGGGGLMSISTFLGSDLVPLRKRGVIQGIGNICYGSGAMLGGVFGGFVHDRSALGWRLAFYAQVPPAIISAVLVAVLVKVPPKVSNKSYLARIDFTGVFLTVGFLVALLLGLNAGGNLVPWRHPLPIAAVSVSVALFSAFWVWEARARQPIIPVRLMLNRTVLAACLTNLCCTMATMMLLFYIPLYLQVRGFSSTHAGLTLLAPPVGTALCSISAGLFMKRTGKYLGLAIFTLSVLVAGAAVLATLDENTSIWTPPGALFFTGGAYGAMLTTTLLACISAVEHSQQAVITSATYLARSLGGTIGLTVASAVYQNILKARLWERFGDRPDAADVIGRIRDDLDEIRALPPGWYEGVLQSFMEAFRGVWLTMLGLAIMGLISVSFMRQHTLHSTLSRS